MKIFNIRPLVIAAISLILTVLVVSNFLIDATVLSLVLLVLLGVAFLSCLAFVVLCLIKFKTKSVWFISAVISLIISLLGAGLTFMVMPINLPQYVNTEVSIVGDVDGVKNYDNVSVVNLRNVEINETSVSGLTEVFVYNYGTELNVLTGDSVKLDAKLTTSDKSFNNLTKLVNNVNFSATCGLSDLEVLNKGVGFKDVVKHKVKDNLFSFLNPDNASIAFSVLFGEKENLSDSIYNAFSYAGIAHILAVSGLHIGFLVSMLVMGFKAIKCNKHLSNIIIFLILLLYAYLCNFTPSVLRALIMSMVLLISKTYGKEYDAISSLSLAAIIVLLTNPMQIYSVGFQLSFVCVLGIITLNKPILKLLTKNSENKLANLLALSLSVNLGVLCITAQHFKQINLISVFSNLIVLPVFSICFCVLILTTLIGLIVPFVNYVLFVPNVMLHFIKLIANFISEINFLNFELFKFNVWLILIALLLCYFIGFALVKTKVKCFISLAGVFIIVCTVVCLNFPAVFNSNTGSVSETKFGNFVFLANSNNERVLIVNELESEEDVLETLNDLKVNKLNALVVNNYSAKDNDLIKNLIETFDVDKLIIESTYSDFAYANFSKITFVRAVKTGTKVCGVEVKFKYFNDKNIGIEFNFENNLTLMLNDGVSKTEINNLVFEGVKYDNVIYNNVNLNFVNLLNANNYVNV